MNAHFLAFWTHGDWQVAPKFPITNVTQDSRTATLGSLYVAIKGDRHDGHDFVAAAFQKGATAAIIQREWPVPPALADLPLLKVDDTRRALIDLARGWRDTLPAFVLGITGSAGKTTVKELAAAMFSGGGATQCTPGNYNNDVGLPLSLLNVHRETRFAVIEAGISHPGDMESLARTLRPNAAIITAIGPAHIAHFENQEAIAREKAVLLQALPSNGYAVIPRETLCFDLLAALCPARVVTTSLTDETADYHAEPLAQGVLRVHHKDETAVLLESGLSGAHNASNVLAAYAAVREAGLSQNEALEGLKRFKAPAMRWEVRTINGYAIINDAYNASPLSMSAGLETFAGTDVPGDKIACVGDMLELGDDAPAWHRKVGVDSGCGPWRLLIGIGPLTRHLLDGAIEAGYPRADTCWFETVEEALVEIKLLVKPGDTLYLKASRGIGLERLEKAFEPEI